MNQTNETQVQLMWSEASRIIELLQDLRTEELEHATRTRSAAIRAYCQQRAEEITRLIALLFDRRRERTTQ